MFDGWEFCYLEVILVFHQVCNLIPSGALLGGGLDNGAVFEFGHDLLLSNSSIVSFRLFRYQCVDLLFDPDCILG